MVAGVRSGTNGHTTATPRDAHTYYASDLTEGKDGGESITINELIDSGGWASLRRPRRASASAWMRNACADHKEWSDRWAAGPHAGAGGPRLWASGPRLPALCYRLGMKLAMGVGSATAW